MTINCRQCGMLIVTPSEPDPENRFLTCPNCQAVHEFVFEEEKMQEQVIKLRGGYNMTVRTNDGEKVVIEVHDQKGVRVDLRIFTHRDLTGEPTAQDRETLRGKRGW